MEKSRSEKLLGPRLPGWWLYGSLTVLTIVMLLAKLSSIPPYVDFDAATDAIFVNNLSAGKAYDASFSGSELYQNRYRVWYAAHRLPFSIPLSWVQQLFQVAPFDLSLLFRIVAVLLGLVGAFFAAAICHNRSNEREAAVFVFLLALVHPLLLVKMRLGFPHWMLTFALFWYFLWALERFSATGRQRYVWLSVPLLSYALLNPYPMLVGLGPFALLFAVSENRPREIFGNVVVYLALMIAVLTASALSATIGSYYDGNPARHMGRVANFRATRSFVFSPRKQLFHTPVSEKMGKFIDQHFLFLRDNLGDRSRDDAVETLGVLHWPLLLCIPVMLFGLWSGLRERDPPTLFYFCVLCSVMLVFLTLSFPEGRYTFCVTPCYGYFLWFGIRRFLPNNRMVAPLVLASIALVSALEMSGPYRQFVLQIWGNREGINAVARHLPERDTSCQRSIFLPNIKDYPAWLEWELASGGSVDWVDDATTFRAAIAKAQQSAGAEDRVFYAVNLADASPAAGVFHDLGFSSIETFPTADSERQLRLLRLGTGSCR